MIPLYTNKQKTGSTPFILLILCLGILLSSCAMPPALQSVDCQGFPFDKEFPGDDHRPLRVNYDLSYKWDTGRDGVYYRFYYRYKKDMKFPENVYNDIHLPHSVKEEKYIAKRIARDREFDKKYAGEIKKKLLAVAKKEWVPPRDAKYKKWWKKTYKIKPMGFRYEKGYTWVKYPYYLTGDLLPEGLETPASFFSSTFFSKYIVAEHHRDYLKNYFISAKIWPKSSRFYDGVMGMARVGGLVASRFDANFAEYVLTYYYYKSYNSLAERRKTAEDLAAYYYEIAFRASAEHLYIYNDILSSGERCDYADHAAKRIYDYIISAFMDKKKFQQIRGEYKDELLEACWTNQLHTVLPDKLPHQRNKEEKRQFHILEKLVLSGEKRCIND